MTGLSVSVHVNTLKFLPPSEKGCGDQRRGLVHHAAAAHDESLHLKPVASGGITDNRQRNREQSGEGPAVKEGLQPGRFLRL